MARLVPTDPAADEPQRIRPPSPLVHGAAAERERRAAGWTRMERDAVSEQDARNLALRRRTDLMMWDGIVAWLSGLDVPGPAECEAWLGNLRATWARMVEASFTRPQSVTNDQLLCVHRIFEELHREATWLFGVPPSQISDRPCYAPRRDAAA